MSDSKTNTEVPQALVLFKKRLTSVKKGENILFKVGNTYSLMKYENHGVEVEGHHTHRYNRHTLINTGPGDFLFADTNEKLQKLNERRRREWKRYKGNIYGTHRLDFSFDEEFKLFLPSSVDRDLFLTLARETFDGEVVPLEGVFNITVGDELIANKLRNITHPIYFDTVISPFLEGRCTQFQTPKWSKRLIRKVNMSTLLNRFEKETHNLANGAFVYVGCKEEVYLLGLTRGSDGRPYMQGTYSTSTKPLFYFSNNHLEFISRQDAEKPKFKGKRGCNVAVYRTYDIPGFNGQPFVFPQMGRMQNCKNSVFTGEPDLITGNVDQALAHFSTTDFSEFLYIVECFASHVDKVHSSFDEPNGRFYY